MRFKIVPLLAVFLSCVSCGRSVYSPAATKDTDEGLKEDAIIALNGDDYVTATSRLEELWTRVKTNETAQLYAISLLGTSGFNLFDLVKKALTSVTDESKKSSSAGNAILDKISAIVGTNVTDLQLDTMKKAIDILAAAPDQTSAGLKFQKCLTAGLYAAPTLGALTARIATINTTLNTLPAKLGAVGASCSASASEVSTLGAQLTGIINDTATLAARIKSIETVVGECLPKEATSSVNTITTQVNKLSTSADKGCTIPATQVIGSYTLPSCMNDFVLAAGGSTAVSGDKKIAGCEVFLNCSGGSTCF